MDSPSVFDVISWLMRDGVLPLPCEPKSKKPIPAISSRAVYGYEKPEDSFHIPSTERVDVIRSWWSKTSFHKKSGPKDQSISIDLNPGYNSGKRLFIVDVDSDNLLSDAMDSQVFSKCPAIRGKKGVKLFGVLADGENPAALTQYYAGDNPNPVLELFTSEKHGLVYGEHPDSTVDTPIFYQCVRGFGDPFPVLDADVVSQEVNRIASLHALSARIRSDVNWDQVKKGSFRVGTISESLNLSVLDWLMPENPIKTAEGLQGGHPVHGSTTGRNFSVNTHDNSWFCHRCGSGGGPLEAFAVARGIIRCEDARPGCLEQHWGEVMRDLESLGYGPALRKAKPIKKAENTATPGKFYPELVVNGRHMRDISHEVLDVLLAENAPPSLFIRARKIVRIVRDERGLPVIEPMSLDALRGRIARVANFVHRLKKSAKGKGGESDQVEHVTTVVHPPLELVRDVMAVDQLPFPPIIGIVETPVIRQDGTFVISRGYDTQTQLFYEPDPGFLLPEIPDTPTPQDVSNAATLLKEIIQDFPFDSDMSRANALAAMITAPLRPLVAGPVPMFIYDKPQAGTGASLLSEVTTSIATGRSSAVISEPETEEEWRKKITTALMNGRTIITIDNIENKLRSPSLAAVLTTTHWEDRVLGETRTIVLPNLSVWIVTGNNVVLGGDMPRRCVWIRMNAEMARPWQRTDFLHEDLRGWVGDNRGRIIAAIMTITRAWIQAGRPVPENNPVIGGFEKWTGIIGGILAYSGIKGFLGNLETMYAETDTDGPQWENFLSAWHTVFKEESITIADLVAYIQRETNSAYNEYSNPVKIYDALPMDILGDWHDRPRFVRRLGWNMTKRVGVTYPNGLSIMKGDTFRRAVMWKVVLKSDQEKNSQNSQTQSYTTNNTNSEKNSQKLTNSQDSENPEISNQEKNSQNSQNSPNACELCESLEYFSSPRVREKNIENISKYRGAENYSPELTNSHATTHQNSLTSLLAQNGINFVPDLTKYRRITDPKVGRCIFPWCNHPKLYEDDRGVHYLCQVHYDFIARKLAERTPPEETKEEST